ncbi:uncharacterized protein METZ01_LOCUS274014, partial [marine metagenome]
MRSSASILKREAKQTTKFCNRLYVGGPSVMITDHILPAKFFVLVYTTIGMLSFANNSAFADAHQSNVDKPTILITGSNRGIGLEFVRQLSLRDWRIIATARAPQDATDLNSLAN